MNDEKPKGMDNTLLPCPFCGSHNLRIHWETSKSIPKFVQCNDCDGSSAQYQQIEHAIQAWNRRLAK